MEMENLILAAVVKECQNSVPGFDYETDDIKFCRMHLGQELLHSSTAMPLFGVRVPPLKTSSMLNILSIVLNAIPDVPKSFLSCEIGQLFDALTVTYYAQGYMTYKKFVDCSVLKIPSVDVDESIKRVIRELNLDFWNESKLPNIDFPSKAELLLHFPDIKTVVSKVLEVVNNTREMQNVFYYPLEDKRQNLTDDFQNVLIYSLINNNDPTLIYETYKKHFSESRTVPVLFYLSYFCFQLVNFAMRVQST